MKFYKNYVLKKLSNEQITQINIDYKRALKFFKNNIRLDPPIIPYEYNKNYYWYKIN
jgi:hypothetical protein